MVMQSNKKPNMGWIHSLNKAIDKLEKNWRSGSGTVDELQEIKLFIYESMQNQQKVDTFNRQCG